MQVAGQMLGRCLYSVQGREDLFPRVLYSYYWLEVPPAHELAIFGADSTEPLQLSQPFQAVLASLVPPRLPLRCLHLVNCQLQPAALQLPQDCRALAAVSVLSLLSCFSPAASFSDSLATLLQHIPGLEQLAVEGCLQPGDPFPVCLLDLAGPTHLSLRSNGLQDLPEGACWAGEPGQGRAAKGS